MFYNHEVQERLPNKSPMNTEWPLRSTHERCYEIMDEYLTARGLSFDLAIKNGWYMSNSAGDGYLRIVIPAVVHKEGHVYWQARDITGQAYFRYQSPKGPRYEAYINVKPLTRPKGVVVVEGPMDALAAADAGYTGIALMGMVPSMATLYHVGVQLATCEKVLVMMDRGECANSTRIASQLAAIGIPARVAELHTKDLAACPTNQRQKFLDHVFESLFHSSKPRNSAKPRTRGKRV